MAIAAPPVTSLDVYGLSVRIAGDWPEVLEALALDFAWFVREAGPAAPHVDVEIRHCEPDFEAFGPVTASFVTPRNVVYQDGERTIIEYFGQAMATLDRRTGRLVVEGEDRQLVHEAAYQFVVSRIGEHLDRRGFVRLHSLGLAAPGGAFAVMLPSGGGKSTLVMRALADERVRLLSEDTPLLDRRGLLHPFPLRIGVNVTDAHTLPEGAVRRIDRMEFHPKYALEIDAFADRIQSEPVPLRHIVIGHRSLGREPRLEPVGRTSAAGPLLREAVFGLGVYQGMEFVLQHGMRDSVSKLGTLGARSACCALMLRQARVWRLTLCRDRELNWTALEPLLG
jgi:hypothetical protein